MKNDTEQQIIEAAKKVFIRKGFDGARMQEIADEAKINKSMLHYYFRSKQFLFERILSDSIQILLPAMMKSISGQSSVIEKAESLVDAYTDTILANPHIPMFVLNELSQRRLDFLSMIKQNMELIGQPKEFFQQILKEQREGVLKEYEPEQVLINILSLIIFPFIAKPMFTGIFDITDENYSDMMNARKPLIKSFLRDTLLA